MNDSVRILLIEDDLSASAALEEVLRGEEYDVVAVARGDEGLRVAQTGEFAAVVSDLKLPGLDGLSLVRQLHGSRPRIPIILMTAHGTTETAIEAMKLGAFDYLLKPFDMQEFLDLVAKAVAGSLLMSQTIEIGEGNSDREAIVGRSRVMQTVFKEIGRVAGKPVPVLIRGETGTGKELIARAIYQHSERSQAAFVAVNCAAIPETLLESELFGHERGAFTGAEARRIGRFEQADGGTLFLDEIGDLALSTQAKLLRVLQERCIQRLGGRETIPVDVRVIAATHRDLESAIAEKQFREDLFYRLNVVSIALPPLRDRADDIPDLVKYFLRRHGPALGVPTATIQPGAIQLLQNQPWPGNIRELENVVRQAVLLSRGYPIGEDVVRESLGRSTRPAASASQSLSTLIAEQLAAAQRAGTDNAYDRVIEEVERDLFAQAMQLAQGNQARAARWLGLSRVTLREKLARHQLRSRPSQNPGPSSELP